ncbi:imidazole glycerol phosphate synthase subunit HisH [Gammaproteobacteria bacterium]|nr:imidazole glycerol phosphate synthase subunit HisH [Gammaproteobacteria bacterium]
MKIVIIDYGMGNRRSIVSAVKKISEKIEIIYSNNPDEIRSADRLILPGVGSFGAAVDNLHSSGLRSVLNELVVDKKIKILGICLGMQLLCNTSDESPDKYGLGYINGHLSRFLEADSVRIPHVGFNTVCSENSSLLSGITNSDFYFTHSYKLQLSESIGSGETMYGQKFISLFEKDNIFGVQFHPELSQKNGIKLIKNFIYNA